MSKIEFSSDVLFLKAAKSDESEGSSYKKFKIVAYTGAEIKQMWSSEPVVIDLQGMELPATVPIVMGHDYSIDSILGQGVPRIEAGQLVVEGEILADSELAKKVEQLSAAGYEWQASVGADVGQHVRVTDDQTIRANGREYQGPVRVVKASALRETSFVTLGADSSTAVSISADAEVEEVLMAADAKKQPTEDVLEEDVKVEASVKVAEENNPSAQDSTAVVAALEALAEKVEKMEQLQATRDERPSAPAAHVKENAGASKEVVQAAFAMQGNLPNLEEKFDEKTLQAAHEARRQISLGEVIIQAAVENGYDGPKRLNASTLRPVLQAAWATHDISGILSATVNKFLLAGFDSVESAWRSISAVRSVQDFKTLTSYRLNGGMVFEQVGNGGELKNAAAGEESRTISADTYGIMTSVTRTDLINDDLGALTAVPQRIGRGGALKLNSVFWTAFQDDSSFFTTARGNKKTSAGALSIANLKAIATLFRKLTDPDGNPVAVDPRILLVPADLELDAAEIMGSSLIQSGATSGQPERNVLAGRYQVVASTYLSNADDYYLLASPSDLPVMEVAFLNGVQSPVVETADADFNTLGVQMRGYFDFGVSQAEYLAGVKADKA